MKCQVDSCPALSIINQSMTLEPGWPGQLATAATKWERECIDHLSAWQLLRGAMVIPKALVIVLLSKRLPMLPQLNTSSLRSWHKGNKKAFGISTPRWPRSDQNWISLCLEQVWKKKKKEERGRKEKDESKWRLWVSCVLSFAYKWIWIRSIDRLLPSSSHSHPSQWHLFFQWLTLECRHKK